MPVVGFTRGSDHAMRSPSRIEEVRYPAGSGASDPAADEPAEPAGEAGSAGDDDISPAQPEPEHAAIRVAKLAALVTAVVLLCAAVVAAAFLDRQRRDAPPHSGPQQVSGLPALAGIEHDGEVAAAPSPAAQRPGGAASSAGGASVRYQEPESSHRAMWTPDPCELAIIFYRRLADEPARALAMLGGRLSDDERQTLLTVWRTLDRVEVRDLRQLTDDRVRASVTMTTLSGGAYRVDHELRVDPPAIVDVILLSSQRLAGGPRAVEPGTPAVCGQ